MTPETEAHQAREARAPGHWPQRPGGPRTPACSGLACDSRPVAPSPMHRAAFPSQALRPREAQRPDPQPRAPRPAPTQPER